MMRWAWTIEVLSFPRRILRSACGGEGSQKLLKRLGTPALLFLNKTVDFEALLALILFFDVMDCIGYWLSYRPFLLLLVNRKNPERTRAM